MTEEVNEELSEEELEEYAEGEKSIWKKGSFIKSIGLDEVERMKKTIDKSHNEDMNFNCRKCNKKISSHSKDWHDGMCDDCFNKEYFGS